MNSEVIGRRIVIFLVSLVMFMEFLDTTIINTAVPSIARSFGEDPLLLKFSVTSYFLSLAIFTPVSGWVADSLGTKKLFLFSVALFVVASFLCGISTNILELTVFRFLQGLGGAFMNPVSRIVILRMFEPKDLVRVQSLIFTPAMLGFILGPFLGGMITTYWHWRWIFYINIPFGILGLILGYYYIPQQIQKNVKKFDWTGFVLSAFALGCVSFAVDMIGHPELVPNKLVIAIGFAGIIFFFNLIYYCRQKRNPIFDFLLFEIHTFRVGFLSNCSTYMLTAGVSFLLPLMFQEHFLYTPARSGALVLAIAFGQLSFRFVASSIIHRIGFKRSMQISSIMQAIALVMLSFVHAHSPLSYILFSEYLFGGASVLFASSTGALNYVDVPKEKTSQATSFDLSARQFVSSLGIGVTALLLNFFRKIFDMPFSAPAALKIFHLTFLILGTLSLISFLQSLSLSKNEGEHALKQTDRGQEG